MVLTGCASVPEPASATEGTGPAGYVLVWSDEFDQGSMPDPEKWTYDTYRNRAGWWNDELQYYSDARPENSRVENGVLVIEARREDLSPEAYPDWGGQSYTSARLHTHERASWTYGYFEVRAKLPCGYGTWPAIWALPDDPREWPEDGEIDIMEHVGQSEGRIHAAVHTRDYNHTMGTQKMASIDLPDPCGTFHVYSLHWTAEAIKIGVDGRVYFTHRNTGEGYGAWPFDRPYHLLLNIAIGGWGGRDGIDESIFPVRFEIDYVRVWQKP